MPELPSTTLSRRQLLRLGGLSAATLAVSSCTRTSTPGLVRPDGPQVAAAQAARTGNGTVRSVVVRPAPATLDLGGTRVDTWAYDGVLPGKQIRVRRGDTVEVNLTNALPTDTTVHWHGLALRNDMDGMPGITQPPIAPGSNFTYRFTADTPGTYWFHPHTGLQLDRGLYAPLIVEDPTDPGTDADWVIVLDDWLDGIAGATPDSVYTQLRNSPRMGMGGGMGMGGRGMDVPAPSPGPLTEAPSSPGPQAPGMLTGATSPLLGGDAGDVSYPYYLINGRTAADPQVLTARNGDRARIRLINAGGDTAFRVALAGHRMTVTHTDGHPVQPIETDAVVLGMGERIDVTVRLGDGVFPLVAAAEGKGGLARALIRTGGGAAPAPDQRPAELNGPPTRPDQLKPTPEERLPPRTPDRELQVRLTGGMMSYDWGIDGRGFAGSAPLTIRQGERVRLQFLSQSMMWHPMHVHGHVFAVGDGGPRKDTVMVLPMQTVSVDFDADNPGQWMIHCHNAYHLEAGMMRTLGYLA